MSKWKRERTWEKTDTGWSNGYWEIRIHDISKEQVKGSFLRRGEYIGAWTWNAVESPWQVERTSGSSSYRASGHVAEQAARLSRIEYGKWEAEAELENPELEEVETKGIEVSPISSSLMKDGIPAKQYVFWAEEGLDVSRLRVVMEKKDDRGREGR